PENWSRANFFEQRATEYLKATKSRRWGGPDGVWCRSKIGEIERHICGSRLESIDCYRWPGIRSCVLCYPILLHGTPLHSHSIISMHRNALIYQRKFFLETLKTRPPSRQNFSLMISKGDLRGSDFARFRRLSTT